jgi:hypothetical protein
MMKDHALKYDTRRRRRRTRRRIEDEDDQEVQVKLLSWIVKMIMY